MFQHTQRMLQICLLCLALVTLSGCPWLQQFGRKESLGYPADFAYTTYAGVNGRLSELTGQPLVLNFWAAWCPPCKAEFPEWQQVVDAHAGEFRILSVAVDESEDPRALVRAQGYSWDFVSSPDDIASLYGIHAIPQTLFIDREGRIVDQAVGALNKAAFEEKLTKIL